MPRTQDHALSVRRWRVSVQYRRQGHGTFTRLQVDKVLEEVGLPEKVRITLDGIGNLTTLTVRVGKDLLICPAIPSLCPFLHVS